MSPVNAYRLVWFLPALNRIIVVLYHVWKTLMCDFSYKYIFINKLFLLFLYSKI